MGSEWRTAVLHLADRIERALPVADVDERQALEFVEFLRNQGNTERKPYKERLVNQRWFRELHGIETDYLCADEVENVDTSDW